MLRGTSSGLAVAGVLLVQGTDGLPDASDAGDWFGDALAAGDFDADGDADLAVGIDGEKLGSTPTAGAAIVAEGSITSFFVAPSCQLVAERQEDALPYCFLVNALLVDVESLLLGHTQELLE